MVTGLGKEIENSNIFVTFRNISDKLLPHSPAILSAKKCRWSYTSVHYKIIPRVVYLEKKKLWLRQLWSWNSLTNIYHHHIALQA